MNFKLFFSITTIIIFSAISFYINNIAWILNFLITIWCYTIIFYCIHIVWNNLRKKEVIESWEYIKNFIFKISLVILISTSTIWWLSFLSNNVFPAEMPEYTISNWEKTVKFQAMVHIWKETFYDEIAKNIENFKEKWWVYFFEWVKPGKEENAKKFNEALWVEFDEDLYKNFSKLYGVTFQDNSKFLWLVNDKDFNVDLNIDQIVELYDEKIKKSEKKETNTPPLDANKEIIKTLSLLNEKELQILVYVNQAMLNLLISSEEIQTTLTNNFWNKELFEVILEERNKVLVNEIVNSEYKDIYTTYWLLHFKWVFNLLKENDPKWEIIEVNNLYPIK